MALSYIEELKAATLASTSTGPKPSFVPTTTNGHSHDNNDIKSRMEVLVNQIEAGNANIAEEYHAWLNIGFALANELGENGRAYFHRISRISSKYSYEETDKKFNECLKNNNGSINISTIFYYVKELKAVPVCVNINGVESGLDENKFTVRHYGSIDKLKEYINFYYNLRRNSVSGELENNGDSFGEIEINSVYCDALGIVPSLKIPLLWTLLNSDFVSSYNPILNFFGTCADRKSIGHIARFASAIHSDTGAELLGGSNAFVCRIITKYLVSIVAAAHGAVVPLVLVLTGGQNTGKSRFFRDLLPYDLLPYYAESKLDDGKDSEILMTQKLLIIDDEFGGKSKRDEKRLKELTSKDKFVVRKPYGRVSETLKRLAVLGGTTNDEQLLNDPTGNRRILPIRVLKLDFDTLNDINRHDLFAEAYHLYHSGFDWQVSGSDITQLNAATGAFEAPTSEGELISQYLALPGSAEARGPAQRLTATEIKGKLEIAFPGVRLSLRTFGIELTRQGYERKQERSGSSRAWLYTFHATEKSEGLI